MQVLNGWILLVDGMPVDCLFECSEPEVSDFNISIYLDQDWEIVECVLVINRPSK